MFDHVPSTAASWQEEEVSPCLRADIGEPSKTCWYRSIDMCINMGHVDATQLANFELKVYLYWQLHRKRQGDEQITKQMMS